MISCSCDYEPDGPGEWWFYPPDDFVKFDLTRRRRCCSCERLINRGEDCLRLGRERNPWNDIEAKIKGDQIKIAPLWMCDECGEIFLNLTAVGYCVSIGPMSEALAEYHEITGFKKMEEKQ